MCLRVSVRNAARATMRRTCSRRLTRASAVGEKQSEKSSCRCTRYDTSGCRGGRKLRPPPEAQVLACASPCIHRSKRTMLDTARAEKGSGRDTRTTSGDYADSSGRWGFQCLRHARGHESPPSQPTLPSPHRGERVRVRGRPSNQCHNELHLLLSRRGLGVYSPHIACDSDLSA